MKTMKFVQAITLNIILVCSAQAATSSGQIDFGAVVVDSSSKCVISQDSMNTSQYKNECQQSHAILTTKTNQKSTNNVKNNPNKETVLVSYL